MSLSLIESGQVGLLTWLMLTLAETPQQEITISVLRNDHLPHLEREVPGRSWLADNPADCSLYKADTDSECSPALLTRWCWLVLSLDISLGRPLQSWLQCWLSSSPRPAWADSAADCSHAAADSDQSRSQGAGPATNERREAAPGGGWSQSETRRAGRRVVHGAGVTRASHKLSRMMIERNYSQRLNIYGSKHEIRAKTVLKKLSGCL